MRSKVSVLGLLFAKSDRIGPETFLRDQEPNLRERSSGTQVVFW